MSSQSAPTKRSRPKTILLFTVGLCLIAAATAVVAQRGSRNSSSEATDVETLGWISVDATHVGLPTTAPVNGDVNSVDPSGVVLVNFWASTCVPCRKELPVLASAAADGVQVVGVTRDQFAKYALRSLKQAGVTYPNWLDSSGDYTYSLANIVPATRVPSTLVLVDGEARAIHLGPLESVTDVQREISKLA